VRSSTLSIRQNFDKLPSAVGIPLYERYGYRGYCEPVTAGENGEIQVRFSLFLSSLSRPLPLILS
jgi:hypothetical protein